MAKAKKGGIDKVSAKKNVKALAKQVNIYGMAIKKIGEDLDLMQTKGKNGTPIWNGTRAKAWYDLAVKKIYNINVRDYEELVKFVQTYENAVDSGFVR